MGEEGTNVSSTLDPHGSRERMLTPCSQVPENLPHICGPVDLGLIILDGEVLLPMPGRWVKMSQ